MWQNKVVTTNETWKSSEMGNEVLYYTLLWLARRHGYHHNKWHSTFFNRFSGLVWHHDCNLLEAISNRPLEMVAYPKKTAFSHFGWIIMAMSTTLR